MDNEDLVTAIVNQMAKMHKSLSAMRAKYVFTDRTPSELARDFQQDAADFANWKKIYEGKNG